MDATLNVCLKLSLSDNCVEFKPNDSSCSKLKRYMTACPDSRPVRPKIDVKVSNSGKIKKSDDDKDHTTAASSGEHDKPNAKGKNGKGKTKKPKSGENPDEKNDDKDDKEDLTEIVDAEGKHKD